MSRKKVLSATKLPGKGKHRWVLELGCGHKVCITAKKPTMDPVRCRECMKS